MNLNLNLNSSEEETTGRVSTLPMVQYEEVWTVEAVQRVVGIGLLMAMTFCGNVTILIVLATKGSRACHRPQQRTTSRVNVFIFNLAIGDLTVLAFTMTSEVLFVVLKRSWTLGNSFCKVLVYIQIVTLASTTFILTGMSLDRYMAICRPLSVESLTSRPRKMIVASWLLAFAFASPQLFIFKQKAVGVYPDGELKMVCASLGYTAWWQRKTYFTFLTAYILLVPFFVISFCYINVARTVWSRTADLHLQTKSTFKFADRPSVEADPCSATSTFKRREKPAAAVLRKSVRNGSAISKAKMKTIKMTLSIICIFMICWTPYFVVHLIHIWSEYEYEIPRSVYAFAETLAFLNSALNPVIYGCFNVKLKRKSRTEQHAGPRGGCFTSGGDELRSRTNRRDGLERNSREFSTLDRR